MVTGDAVRQFLSDKKVWVTSVMIISGVVCSLLPFLFTKVMLQDDYYFIMMELPMLKYAVYLGSAYGFVAGPVLMSWVIVSVYLMVKGRSEGRSSKRNLGIGILVGPLVFFLVSSFLVYGSFFEVFDWPWLFLYSLMGLLALVLTITGIVYAFKIDAKIALIPLILIPALVILGGMLLVSFSVASFLFFPPDLGSLGSGFEAY